MLILKKKIPKFNVHSKNTIKMEKFFLVFQITVFELVAVNFPYYYENTRSP